MVASIPQSIKDASTYCELLVFETYEKHEVSKEKTKADMKATKKWLKENGQIVNIVEAEHEVNSWLQSCKFKGAHALS